MYQERSDGSGEQTSLRVVFPLTDRVAEFGQGKTGSSALDLWVSDSGLSSAQVPSAH